MWKTVVPFASAGSRKGSRFVRDSRNEVCSRNPGNGCATSVGSKNDCLQYIRYAVPLGTPPLTVIVTAPGPVRPGPLSASCGRLGLAIERSQKLKKSVEPYAIRTPVSGWYASNVAADVPGRHCNPK